MQDSINRVAMACVIIAAFATPGCVSAGKYYTLEQDLQRSEEALAQAQQALLYSQENLQAAELYLTQAGNSEQRASQLAAELTSERERAEALGAELRLVSGRQSDLATFGLEEIINAEEGMIGYRGEGDVFFSSGRDALTAAGKGAIDKIISRLASTSYPIRIDGHTDNDPIIKSKDLWPRGNIMLAAHRAMSVRDYLISQGIPGNRITIASFGPFKPVTGGTDAASKAKNRRVEIMLKVLEGTGR
jgi:chemotaxis protein MotB